MVYMNQYKMRMEHMDMEFLTITSFMYTLKTELA